MSMKKKIGVLALGVLSVSFVGCAIQAPTAVNHPPTTQRKIQAAHHWDVLAADVGAKVMESLGGRSVHIRRPHSATPFNVGFYDLLTTQLVNQGVTVSFSKQDSLILDYHVQVLRHHERGYIHPYPGALTATAAGGAVIYNLARNSASAAGAIGAAAVLGDVFLSNYTEGTPDTEILISTSLSDGYNYVGRTTGIYYVNEEDTKHYKPHPTTRTKSMKVVSK